MDSTTLAIGAVALTAVAATAVYSCTARGGAGAAAKGSASASSSASAATVDVRTGVTLAELPAGTMKEVKLEGGKGTVLLVHTSAGALSATSAKCTHYGARLVTGVLSGERIVCPWHGACFNAATGDIEDGPVLNNLASYGLRVAGGGGGGSDELILALPASTTAVPTTAGVPPRTCAPSPSACAAPGMVIVGAGAAAAAAVETLRGSGYAGRITVLSRERELPYDRPKLSKSMDVSAADIRLRDASWYARLGVELRLGVSALEVRPAAHTVLCSDGATLPYAKLLCASGGAPRRFLPPERFVTPGAALRGVFPLRELGDAAAIEAALAAAPGGAAGVPVVIVGSSFIGMEAAAYLRAMRGVASVTVVGMEAVPFERVLGREVGAYMEGLHRARGVAFALEATVARFNARADDAGALASVTLASGAELPAGLCIVGAGIIPALDYVTNDACAAAGVEILAAAPGGVRVDAQLATGAPDIYAAGDVAYFPYTQPGAQPLHTRIEHWDVAHDHGRIAARNMLGHGVAYDKIPFFWTTSYSKSLRYAGHVHKYTRLIVHGSLVAPDGAFTAYYVAGTPPAVAAVATLNRDPQAVAALELLRLNAMPAPAELAARDDFDLAAHLRAHHAAAAAAAAASSGSSGAPSPAGARRRATRA